jgi:hypothetical protein
MQVGGDSAKCQSMFPLLIAASIALPGTPPVSMDYLAYDAANDRVWIPAGNTGNAFVYDVASAKLLTVANFATAKMKGRDGNERTVGPSSATVGEGLVYIGSRADKSICEVDAVALAKKRCVVLDSSPDGIAYVATTKEIWVTTPRNDSLAIIDARSMKVTDAIKVNSPEGYAVDAARGLFYTNSEDKDLTNVVDVKTRKLVKSFDSKCGAPGPRGLALGDDKIYVACAAGKVNIFKDGALTGSIDAGEGLDNIDYWPTRKRVYAAGGKAANLTIADDSKTIVKVDTAAGARVVVVDKHGTAYVSDSKGGQIILIKSPAE